ncbi:hypothetical protein NUW58_g3453 [Xylaria curta]|uniref:Uncharacterized protein n=1 Tax=Xylaria curta TaxID=42375 RepID=A0ACC1PDK8_9PEZI|nr:hypothetical protein NUW58_g3453 [Xylaria curta]
MAWLYSVATIVGLGSLVQLGQNAAHTLFADTHCYQGVRSNGAADEDVNCFSVSRTGKFSKVFKASSDSKLSETAHPGYAIPGLWDGHGHLLQYGEFLNSVDLFGSMTMDEVRGRVRQYINDHPGAGTAQEWIRGVGWDQMALGAMPTAADLAADKDLKDLYIMLDRVDVHCIWVSQAVLDLLPEDLPDIPGGEIVRNPGMGVFCDNAMTPVVALWPKPDDEKKAVFLKSAMRQLNQYGLVGMHDAGVSAGNLNLFKKLVGSEDWTVRVYAMAEYYDRNAICPDPVERYNDPSGFLNIQSVKLFADGALGSWGSAMIDDYSDRPGISGSLLVNASELTYRAVSWATKGFQVNIHAIGDLANRYAIDAHIAALRLLCPCEPLADCQARHRFRIEHSQIIHEDDQARMHGIGIIPSIQPTHATSDMAYAEQRLGKERTEKEAYRMRSLLDIRLVLGSDFPVEPADPFQGIYAAVTRRSPHTGRGASGFPDGWHTKEALSLDQAFRGFTEGPAYGGFTEGKTGVIKPGAFADWVVLDKPLEDMNIEEFRSLKGLSPIMRSQVTRHVLRRPPTARAIATSSLGSPAPRPTFRTYPLGCRVPRTVQRRTFFKLFQKPPRTLKDIETEPGYETLLTFRAAENDNLRRPPIRDLVKAWQDFFNYKARHNRVVNSTQALCARRVLAYLIQPENVDHASLSLDDIQTAMRCLEKPPRDDPSAHLDLSTALFREIRRREEDGPATTNSLKASNGQSKYLHSYLVALSQYGKATEAKNIFLENLPDPKQLTTTEFHPRRSLLPILQGLAKEGQEQALREVVKEAVKSGVLYDVSIHGVMTSFFAQRDNFEETKFWWARPIRKGLHPAPRAYYDVLQFALRNDKKEWAMEIYEDLIAQVESGALGESKACWDVSFQFAFLLLGKGIDQIEHMFNVALDHTKDTPKARPNIGSINSLLRCAIDKDDPYMAERFISLSKKMGFEPDLSTYILQLEYRLRAEDHEGAFATYQALRGLETSSNERALPVLNKLIRGLCASSRPDYEKILDVTSYLEQRHVTLEPETVVSICMAFLKNDETYEVIDTLSLHTAHYSIDERWMVRESFVSYCLDEKNSTARVWDAYALLRQFFPELEIENRVDIMDAFFDRRRPDMACHVFGHMRSHDNLRYRPTLETYVRCLEGIGRCPDMESLKMIHNMAKMDTTIQLNTQLYNALMIGYIACDTSHRALDFWKEITTSPEGPSYATLEIVFRAYEAQPYGDVPGRELWAKITKMDIDVPENVYGAYLTMLAAHSHLPDVKILLHDSDSIIEKRPDFLTFAYIYNALPAKEMKEDFESWVQHEYSLLWKALTQKHRRRKDEDGLLQFKILRPWKA